LDTLVTFETAAASPTAPPPVRYAVRQVLDQEYQKNIIVRANAIRQARYKAGNPNLEDADIPLQQENEKVLLDDEKTLSATKRDFFGRVIGGGEPLREIDGNATTEGERDRKRSGKAEKVWVSYHEGFSNAVRKPITIEELLRGL
jgi:chromosome transmission fidelity protein 18